MRTDTFTLIESSDPQHVALTEAADLDACRPRHRQHHRQGRRPAFRDDLVSLLVCAAACPVVFAPAMNNRMWDNRSHRRGNVAKLTKLNYKFIGPAEGWLACRNVGRGKIERPSANCRSGSTHAQ